VRCTRPRDVGFKSDGKTIAWSLRHRSKEYSSFQLPCGKCLSCRLEYARSWAVRCVHEAKMHPENSFITLTYSDENLGDPKLNYRDFQLFMKKLRFAYPNREIGYFVTGEYGEQRKRKHWHALIFNWRPTDCVYKYSNERGDQVFSSKTLDRLWTQGITEIGSVTFESAGYCARYAAKKLVHGPDESHEYTPISKKSSKHAIGKKWLEKYHEDLFNYGNLIINGRPAGSIPRYYEKWLQKHHPQKWVDYVTQAKLRKSLQAAARSDEENKQNQIDNYKIASDNPMGWQPVRTQAQHKEIITKKNVIERLFKFLKL
jgi:hypothetical protein